MAERSFTVSTTVPVGPEEAIDFLVDLRRHTALHPFLVEASVVEEGAGWQEWAVVERPTLGPVSYAVRFRARIARPSPTAMSAEVRLRPGVRLDSTTTAEPDPAGARLTETTTVGAPWPLLGYVARSAERAHRQTFDRLPDALRGP